MGKTNFSKVEKALEEGMRKLTSDHLLEEASAAQGKSNPMTMPRKEILYAILQRLDQDLKILQKEAGDLYKSLSFPRHQIKKMLADTSLLKPEEWTKIQEVRKKVEAAKKKITLKDIFQTDDDLVEGERKKHINKRFNVNDKWLPLK